jgi:hypothetical protein
MRWSSSVRFYFPDFDLESLATEDACVSVGTIMAFDHERLLARLC